MIKYILFTFKQLFSPCDKPYLVAYSVIREIPVKSFNYAVRQIKNTRELA